MEKKTLNFSRGDATSVASTATERQTIGGGDENRNENKSERKPRFNREFNKCGIRGYRSADFCAKKGKQKDDDVNNLFVGAPFCGEVQ